MAKKVGNIKKLAVDLLLSSPVTGEGSEKSKYVEAAKDLSSCKILNSATVFIDHSRKDNGFLQNWRYCQLAPALPEGDNFKTEYQAMPGHTRNFDQRYCKAVSALLQMSEYVSKSESNRRLKNGLDNEINILHGETTDCAFLPEKRRQKVFGSGCDGQVDYDPSYIPKEVEKLQLTDEQKRVVAYVYHQHRFLGELIRGYGINRMTMPPSAARELDAIRKQLVNKYTEQVIDCAKAFITSSDSMSKRKKIFHKEMSQLNKDLLKNCGVEKEKKRFRYWFKKATYRCLCVLTFGLVPAYQKVTVGRTEQITERYGTLKARFQQRTESCQKKLCDSQADKHQSNFPYRRERTRIFAH